MSSIFRELRRKLSKEVNFLETIKISACSSIKSGVCVLRGFIHGTYEVIIKISGTCTLDENDMCYETLICSHLLQQMEVYTPHVLPSIASAFNIRSEDIERLSNPFKTVLADYLVAFNKKKNVLKSLNINVIPSTSQSSLQIQAFTLKETISNLNSFYLQPSTQAAEDSTRGRMFFDILFQLMWTLEVFNRSGLRHNDLHLINIHVTKLASPESFSYEHGRIKRTIFSHLLPFIFDYNHSSWNYLFQQNIFNSKTVPNLDGNSCDQYNHCADIDTKHDAAVLLVSVASFLMNQVVTQNLLLHTHVPPPHPQKYFSFYLAKFNQLTTLHEFTKLFFLKFLPRVCTMEDLDKCNYYYNEPRRSSFSVDRGVVVVEPPGTNVFKSFLASSSFKTPLEILDVLREFYPSNNDSSSSYKLPPPYIISEGDAIFMNQKIVLYSEQLNRMRNDKMAQKAICFDPNGLFKKSGSFFCHNLTTVNDTSKSIFARQTDLVAAIRQCSESDHLNLLFECVPKRQLTLNNKYIATMPVSIKISSPGAKEITLYLYLKIFPAPLRIDTANFYEAILMEKVIPTLIKYTPHLIPPLGTVLGLKRSVIKERRKVKDQPGQILEQTLDHFKVLDALTEERWKEIYGDTRGELGIGLIPDVVPFGNEIGEGDAFQSSVDLRYWLEGSRVQGKFNEAQFVARFYQVIFQVLYTLEVFNRQLFRHNDLHIQNIILQITDPMDRKGQLHTFVYELDEGGKPIEITSEILVKIIDYDLSWSYDISKELANSKTLPLFSFEGTSLCKDFGVCALPNPRYDTYRFLLSLHQQLMRLKPEQENTLLYHTYLKRFQPNVLPDKLFDKYMSKNIRGQAFPIGDEGFFDDNSSQMVATSEILNLSIFREQINLLEKGSDHKTIFKLPDQLMIPAEIIQRDNLHGVLDPKWESYRNA